MSGVKEGTKWGDFIKLQECLGEVKFSICLMKNKRKEKMKIELDVVGVIKSAFLGLLKWKSIAFKLLKCFSEIIKA